MSRRLLGAAALVAAIAASNPAFAVTYYGPWSQIEKCGEAGDCEAANVGAAVRGVIEALKAGDQEMMDTALAALRKVVGNNHQLADLASNGPTPRNGLGFGGSGGGGSVSINALAEEVDEDDGTLTIASIPLPASLLLLGSAVAGLGLLGRRRL